MHHICKNKKGELYIVEIADNWKVLNQVEGLTSKPNCFKNIRAQLKNVHNHSGKIFYEVQDDTTPIPTLWKVFENGKAQFWRSDPPTRYIPGINKKKKKK